MDLAGEPMLLRHLQRACRAKSVHQIVVATTTSAADESIVELCTRHGVPYFRGSEDDVLDRYYQTAVAYGAETIVRLTADCPLIEPAVIDQVVHAFLDHWPHVDYVCNLLPRRTFPRGLDTEVMSMAALECAWREDHNLAWREHVTPYIRHNPNRFHSVGIMNHVDYSHMRWTVDTPEDLEFARRIYTYFRSDTFSWRDVITLLEQYPAWLEINRHITQTPV